MSTINRIIQSFFEKDHPDKVRKDFTRWFFSFSSKEKDEALFRVWESIQTDCDASTGKSFREVERRLGWTQHRGVRFSFRKWAQAAAVFLVPLLSIGLSWMYVHNHTVEETAWVECFVPSGEIRTVVLPDRSEVTVNSGSTLLYPAAFKGKVRNIYLSGEAKFAVASDKRKPFIVKTNHVAVEALGTVFTVSSYPDNPCTAATLVEGKVKVAIASTDSHFILSPGEQIVYNKHTGESRKQKTRLDYALAWEKGQLVFQSASLYSIIKELERHFGITVYLNATDLSGEKITVKFLYDETLDEILYALQQIIAGFKYKVEGDKVYIY